MIPIVLGMVVVYSTDDWSGVARWDADDTFVRGIAISPDQQRLVTTSEHSVRVWQIGAVLAGDLGEGDRPPLLDEIPVVASDALWIDENSLGLALRTGQWITVELEAEDVVADILTRLDRSFTDDECADFGIEPCPTLENLLGG